jgi:hypothetical protein
MRIVRLILGFAALLAVPVSLFSQAGATGSILGAVTDSTGAVIPGAQVTVTNTATNVSAKTVSSSSGDYSVPSLIPGPYRVTVEASGFAKSVTTGIVLAVDQKIRVDAVMKAGAVTSTVTVSAQAVTLDTDSESQSQLLTQRQVTELPLNGRNFMQLLLVTPGAVTVGGEQGTMRQGEGNAISLNGGRPEGNNYTLDGLVNTDPSLVTPAVIPSIDALQEFQVQSGAYSAEYGYSASQVNLVTRSGGNALRITTSFRMAARQLRYPHFARTSLGMCWTARCIFPRFTTATTRLSFWQITKGGAFIMGRASVRRFQVRRFYPATLTERRPTMLTRVERL